MLPGEVKELILIALTFNRILRKNAFNDTLDMGNNISQQLQLVDLQNNDISSVVLSSGYSKTLLWVIKFKKLPLTYMKYHTFPILFPDQTAEYFLFTPVWWGIQYAQVQSQAHLTVSHRNDLQQIVQTSLKCCTVFSKTQNLGSCAIFSPNQPLFMLYKLESINNFCHKMWRPRQWVFAGAGDAAGEEGIWLLMRCRWRWSVIAVEEEIGLLLMVTCWRLWKEDCFYERQITSQW